MVDFTKRKFQLLSTQSQHKKCAEVLRCLYDKLIHDHNWESDWQHYQQFLQWMSLPIPLQASQKIISDCYHSHLQSANISKREHHFLPSIRKGDRTEGAEPWPIAIYLDHLRSAHNVGSILRTVEAFSMGTVYFSPETPFVTHQQVQNTAMGAHQWVKCYQNFNFLDLPRPLIVLETSSEAVQLYDFNFPPSFTLAIGNEEYGCSDELLKNADYLIEIPLRGRKNSLNVANAFAIAAGEITRQNQFNVERKL